MTLLIDLALRSSVILAAGLLLEAALRNRAAALRHCVLAGAIAAAATVVPLSLAMPSWEISLPSSRQAPAIQPQAAVTAAVTRAAVPAPPLTPAAARLSPLAGVWLAGFLAAAAMLLTGIARLARIAARAEPVRNGRWARMTRRVSDAYGLNRQVVVLQTDAPDLLATWGFLRPRVLLPAHAQQWSDDRVHVVLCHELAHIRRHDWLVQIGVETLRTVLWFNPLMWIACTRLRRASEQACDDAVLGRGVAARDYASHLLDLARACRRSGIAPLPAVPMARPSTLERRIADMLNPALDRQALSRRALGLTAALLLAVTLPTAALRAGQSGPAPLSGSIYDATGAVLPGVNVTLEDVTQMKYQARTDATGRFAFSNVQPGRYVLEASLAGFRAMRQELDLSARPDWDRAITLQVGNVQETITVSERRVAAAAAPASKGTERIRVGGNIRAPRKLVDVHPVYPASMRESGREGIVPIEAIIGQDGSVTSVRVVSAQVHPDFAIAAVDAVRQWKFSPTLLNGAPVEVVMTVSVAFKLSDQ
jgi:TonB family protein